MNVKDIDTQGIIDRMAELIRIDECDQELHPAQKKRLIELNEVLFTKIKGALYGGPRYKCTHCNDVIRSLNRHHMCFCMCKRSAVDGGNDYVKLCGTPFPVLVPYPKKDSNA